MEQIPEELKGLLGKPELQLGIGDLAHVTGVSQSQLRYWESKNYIQSIKTSESKNRKYSLKTIGEVHFIKNFLDEGFTLTAAVKKAEKRKEFINFMRKVIIDRFEALTEVDGHPAIDLGPLEGQSDQNIFAILIDQEIILRLLPAK
ncbi:MerR family transcriptional regulator [Paucilactobacillus kaifaensis]|uniref:MerR family transcriptional regulator n=1 Tax=Paucilactobacillus kaifaensis TaxID=2559921 RepID=UPI0010F44B44|nr:MerR family transcriptional regulator [Paucilactobacillus kaifaensis]